MGRSEEKSKKRRSHFVSDDEGEGKRKKHRSSEDRARKKSEKKDNKRKNKDKEKSKKSHRHSRDHQDKGTKSAKKRDGKRSKGSTSVVDVEELSSGDYYSKNNEFATWLKEEKGLFFSDLSSEDSHKLFISFVKDWNSKKLQSRYYEGITSAPRTAHNWKIRNDKAT
eukprot:TRINITY_DN2908_c0_g1_i1.p1 TRINITY_DN2908_c0_g1~~TRINITY_DN2908_c0_g1_i1.p1  ORF type:complete len:167 (+),score=43.32 TRINITY_DN2908_c0_g1_i1:197-697(+)